MPPMDSADAQAGVGQDMQRNQKSLQVFFPQKLLTELT